MILRALARLVGEVAVWTALVTLVAAAVAFGARRAIGHRVRPSTSVAASLVSALVLAGLADRLGLPQPLVVDVGRRPLPLAWVLGGAIAGTALVWLRHRGSGAPARGVSVDSGSPAGEDDGVSQ